MSSRPLREKEPITESFIHENPVINRVYQNRGIQSIDDVRYSLKDLIPPENMKGVKEAASIISHHILKGSNIVIIGDYDCDGATSVTLAVEGFKSFGAENVEFVIPDRVKHGYGLTPAIVGEASKLNPDLIVTVDNGISSFDGAEAVKSLKPGCDLVVTDHHLPAASMRLPVADALVNPNQPGCPFESKSVAGCGVMFYVLLGMRRYFHDNNLYESVGIDPPNMSKFLDVVSLGTVADVVPLDKNNRILVSSGLSLINKGIVRPGLRSLLEEKGKVIGEVKSSDFGFSVGPSVNAAGRLDDMGVGVRCLLSTDDEDAQSYAHMLTSLNEKRKEITQDMVDTAVEIIESESLDKNSLNAVSLYKDHWHEGVVGILAGRIKERLNRPVVCFTQTKETSDLDSARIFATNNEFTQALSKLEAFKEENDLSDDLSNAVDYCIKQINDSTSKIKPSLDRIVDRFGEIKGSCRSIPGVNIKDILDEISKDHPDVVSKFGGHAMAAGITINLSDFNTFRSLLDSCVGNYITEEMKIGETFVDMLNIDSSLINIETAQLIESEGPWGQKFEPPLFGGEFLVDSMRVLKDKHIKMSLKHPESGDLFDAIQFNALDSGEIPRIAEGDRVQVAYKMDVNDFKGKRGVQFLLDECQHVSLEHDFSFSEEDASLLSGVESDQKKSMDEYVQMRMGQ